MTAALTPALAECPQHPELFCRARPQCGGCPLLGTDPETQLEHKLGRLRVELARHGVTDLGAVPPRMLSPEPRLAYRNRVRLQVDRVGTIQFFNPHKLADCAVLARELRALCDRIRRWSASADGGLAGCSHLEARVPDLDGMSAVCFTLAPTAAPGSQQIAERLHELGDDVQTQVVRAGGDEPGPWQRFAIHRGVYQYVPLGGFMQVNFAANAALADQLIAGALARGARSFVDAYCGSGNLSLPLLAAGLRGEGVERWAPSADAAARAAHEQGFGDAQFHAAHAGSQAAQWRARAARFDLVVIDPPRAGAREALLPLAQLARHHVALCSCNATTLAREIATLTHAGFALEEVCVIDMFPHTEHVEVLAWLQRCREADRSALPQSVPNTPAASP